MKLSVIIIACEMVPPYITTCILIKSE